MTANSSRPIMLDPIDALAWQLEMGADECIEPTPQMPWVRLKSASNLPQTAPKMPQNAVNLSPNDREMDAVLPPRAPTGQPPAPSLAAAIAEARALATAATDLSSLELAVRSFNGCNLKKTATNTVFAQGVAESRVMFIGEAPGADEDRNGVPFCGVSGQLLDKMLRFIGLERDKNFYITNSLFWRPPGNRQPTPEELSICRPFVEKHIALINPKLLILVGGTATQSLLATSKGITRLRGQRFEYTNEYMDAPVPVHVIYHPSYLLRQPIAKKQTWADLLALKALLAAV